MMHSRYQMFKAVYFHKTVRSGEVMILESIRLADKELKLSSLNLEDFLKLTDDYLLAKYKFKTPITLEGSDATKKLEITTDNSQVPAQALTASIHGWELPEADR